MNVLEPGVLPGSVAYFHTCSALAKKMFFLSALHRALYM